MLMGQKINLRRIEPPDLWQLWAWHEEEELYLFRQAKAFISFDEVAARFTELFAWKGDFIVEAKEGRPMGVCSWKNMVWKNRTCELELQMGTKNQSESHAADAVLTMCALLFHELDMFRVGAFVPESEIFNRDVLEKNGFERDGILREHVFKDGAYEDVWTYAALKKSWKRAEKK
jgi:RimJ/RimL family protein N-acetyltransferase